MEIQQLHTQVTRLIQEGKTEKAIDTFLKGLPSGKKFGVLKRFVQNNQVFFKTTQKKEMSGLVSPTDAQINYNNITNNLLQLLEHLKDGTEPPEGLNPVIKTKTWQKRILQLVAAIAIILLIGVGFFIKKNSDTISCPDFPKQSDLNVLLLPFKSLAGGNLTPEVTIKQRLDGLCTDHKFNAATNIFNRFYDQENAQMPNPNDAQIIGQDCSASLVVWGTAEKVANNIEMSAQFRFAENSSKFDLTKIQLEGETVVDSIKSVSSIAREGTITKDIERLILTLFGIVAHEEKQFAVAADALEKVANDTSASLMTNMLLAESYLELDEKEKALNTYDRALDIHPNYALALNNRGMLLYEKQQYQAAIRDFSNALKSKPKSATTLVARGAAYQKINEIEKAKIDYDAAKRINPNIKLIQVQPSASFNNSLRPAVVNPNVISSATLLQNPKFFSKNNEFLKFYSANNNSNITYPQDFKNGNNIIFGKTFDAGQRQVSQVIKLAPNKAHYWVHSKIRKKDRNGNWTHGTLKYDAFDSSGTRINNYARNSGVKLGWVNKGTLKLVFYRNENINSKEYFECRVTAYDY